MYFSTTKTKKRYYFDLCDPQIIESPVTQDLHLNVGVVVLKRKVKNTTYIVIRNFFHDRVTLKMACSQKAPSHCNNNCIQRRPSITGWKQNIYIV